MACSQHPITGSECPVARVLVYMNIDLSTGIMPLSEQQECMARQFDPGHFGPKASIHAGVRMSSMNRCLRECTLGRCVAATRRSRGALKHTWRVRLSTRLCFCLYITWVSTDRHPGQCPCCMYLCCRPGTRPPFLTQPGRTMTAIISFCQTSALNLPVFPRHYSVSDHSYPCRLLAIRKWRSHAVIDKKIINRNLSLTVHNSLPTRAFGGG